MIGLAVILRNEYPLIDTFINENEIFTLFNKVVFVDDFSDDGSYEHIAEYLAAGKNGLHRSDMIYRRNLNYDFSRQRNYAASLLGTDYICRIDLDELMNEPAKQFIRQFGEGKHFPPETIKGKEFYQIYRDEIIDGELKEVSEQPFIYFNHPRIYWVRTVHEWLAGYETKGFLPDDCRLLHYKSLERCARQNLFYHDNFAEHRKMVGAV